jgi:r-opsin
MTAIAYDRYNVIVKGITGKPLTHSGAVFRVFLIWTASIIWTALPLFGWNRYTPEGNMTACGTDYLTKGWQSRSYVLVYGLWVYFVPFFLICYSYFFIMKAVSAHEKSMREQAKRMNVTSLRAENSQKSVECKLAKVALMTISLWFMAWSGYLFINFASIFDIVKITPLGSIWSSVFAKANSCYNPIVYAISHPKYRAALSKHFPALVCSGELEDENDAKSSATEMSKVPEIEKVPA